MFEFLVYFLHFRMGILNPRILRQAYFVLHFATNYLSTINTSLNECLAEVTYLKDKTSILENEVKTGYKNQNSIINNVSVVKVITQTELIDSVSKCVELHEIN